jgi:translation initiation factor IF-2
MAKEKVYKLAQEFKVSSEALVQMLRQMGITVKSHMSTVDENLRDEIKKKFESERAEIKKEYERKKQIIIKAKEEFAKVDKPAPLPEPPKEVIKPQPAPVVAPVSEENRERDRKLRNRVYSAAEFNRDEASPRIKSMDFIKITPPVAGAAPSAPSGGRTDSRPSFKKGKKKSGKKKFARPEIDEMQLKATIKKTLAKIGSGSERKKYKKELRPKEDGPELEKKILNVSEFVTVSELTNMMHAAVSEVIAKCLELGLFVTINQRLDFETIELVADEFGYTAQLMTEYAPDAEETEEEDAGGNLEPRAPVVTVMGHVDHGKTSLLDYIRKTNVIAGEAGGITQHIAAYEVVTAHGAITFLDTPGHEAFTAMRARGSQITDVIVLIVAADAGVMPQTKEAIDHARAANVPIVVAINKVDLPTANVDRVKSELANYNVLVEGYGGQVTCVEISAKTGKGVDKLLEILSLETQIMELNANPEGQARGVVIESELDKGKGPVATVLIQKGTLVKGDAFITGIHYGRVRDLFNDRGAIVENARPSQPVLVLGLSGTPQAGDSFRVVFDEKDAREISARRRLAQKERELRKLGGVSLDHLYEAIKAGKVKTLNLIIKGDVDGSVEALASSLEKLSTGEIKIHVIHKSVGAIKESDISLALASKAIIIGFHLNPNSKIRELAKKDGVDIRIFRIIYEAIDAMKNAMEGMLDPETKETIIAQVEVRQIIKVTKSGIIAGCFVVSGMLRNGSKARVIRDDVELTDAKISSLRRHKDDVREVAAGFECGLTLDTFSDFKENDRIEVYEETQVARKLSL